MTEYTEDQLNEMSIWDICLLISSRPAIFYKLSEEQIDGIDAYWLLRDHPHLFDKFTKEQIEKLDGESISWLLEEQPTLAPLFNKEKTGLAEDFEEAKIHVKCLLDSDYYTKLSEEETGDCTDLRDICSYVSGDVSGLTGDITGLRGDCSGIWGDCSDIWGDCTYVSGDVSGLTGDITGLRGDLTGIWGDCSDLWCDIREKLPPQEEREAE